MNRMDERTWKERAESAELRLKRVLNRAAWHRKYLVSVNDYEKACKVFKWQSAKKELAFFEGKMNAAYNAVDRHVENGLGKKTESKRLRNILNIYSLFFPLRKVSFHNIKFPQPLWDIHSDTPY